MRHLVRHISSLALTVGLLVTAACGSSRQSGICGDINPEPTAQGDAAATDTEAEAAWAQRSDEAKARAAVDLWDKAVKIDPSRSDLRMKAARAHYFLADSHIWFKKNVDGDEKAGEAMAAHYREAANLAEMSLGQKYPGFRSKYCARQPFGTALEQRGIL